MENTPLGIVLAKVKAQLNYSMTPGDNPAEDRRLYQLIIDQQLWLADRWDFPTLEQFWDVPISVAGRYSAIPTVESGGTQAAQAIAFNKRRPLEVYGLFSAYWNLLDYGITEEQYNNINSDSGQLNDPIQRWRYSDTTEFEVWPVPASAGQVVRFRGQRILNTLFTDNNPDPTLTLDLDDQMVALWVAANHLIQNENPLGKQKMAEAIEQLNFVRANEPRYERQYIMGTGFRKQAVKLEPFQVIAVHG